MQTITYELSKKLNEAGLLDNFPAENAFFKIKKYDNPPSVMSARINDDSYFKYKTLTTGEAIELLLEFYSLKMSRTPKHYFLILSGIKEYKIMKETQIEAIESALEYLLTNNKGEK